jgi:quercetin dioxygenase-like cupin family protein
MKEAKLSEMHRGWFIGKFVPSVFETEACEVAVKVYAAGDREASHYHRVSTEITVVISGKIRMRNREWGLGDIIVIEPGEATDFEAVTDAVNVVVKLPGELNDKFLLNP